MMKFQYLVAKVFGGLLLGLVVGALLSASFPESVGENVIWLCGFLGAGIGATEQVVRYGLW